MAKTITWQNRITRYGDEAPDQLLAHPLNFRLHPKPQQDALAGVLRDVGVVQNIIVNERTGHLIDGHLRISLAMRDNQPTVPVTYVDLSPEEEELILATLDPISAMASSDADKLRQLLDDVSTGDAAVMQLLSDLAEDAGVVSFPGIGDEPSLDDLTAAPPEPIENATLAERFLVPPFSVLDARQGYWIDRKRAWLDLGIQSEIGRGANLLDFSDGINERHDANSGKYARTFGQDLMKGEHVVGQKSAVPGGGGGGAWAAGGTTGYGKAKAQGLTLQSNSGRDPDFYAQKRRVEAELGRTLTTAEFEAEHYVNEQTGSGLSASGTSVFDPVLCELAYRWFSPPGGAVLDPFAGGSVRGIVAARLGRSYTGIDLSAPQIAANEVQAEAIVPGDQPTWIVGDSLNVVELVPAGAKYDFLFSCPPYADLEVYSDDPRDLSTMDYTEFLRVYHQIIERSLALLRNDRFACFVVGDVRGPKGHYRNFVSDTIAAFQDAGALLYNEAILVTSVGSLPIRVGRQFEAGRKLGKTHQNVLVFVKGDARAATEAVGPVDLSDDLFREDADAA